MSSPFQQSALCFFLCHSSVCLDASHFGLVRVGINTGKAACVSDSNLFLWSFHSWFFASDLTWFDTWDVPCNYSKSSLLEFQQSEISCNYAFNDAESNFVPFSVHIESHAQGVELPSVTEVSPKAFNHAFAGLVGQNCAVKRSKQIHRLVGGVDLLWFFRNGCVYDNGFSRSVWVVAQTGLEKCSMSLPYTLTKIVRANLQSLVILSWHVHVPCATGHMRCPTTPID